MRILIAANSSVGLVKFRSELIKKLKENHEVFVAVKLDKCVRELQNMVDKVIEIDMDRRGTNPVEELRLYRSCARAIESIRPDFVITYTIKPNIYCGLAAGKQKIPYAANITGLGTAFQKEGFLKRNIVRLYRKALKNAKVVFFENAVNARVFSDYRIVRQDNQYILHGAGVNLQKFSFQEYPAKQKINFLFMGRLMKEKGVGELFEAAEQLYRVRKDFVLTILGGYEEDYQEKVAELERLGIVNYVGWVDDVAPYIKECMCTVLPSYHEGMSNTLLECAAMGRPIIASDIAGCREAVLDGKSGYLVHVKDSKDLFEKMRMFCALSPEERVQMGRASRAHMEKNFDKDQVVKETIDRMGLI